MTRADWILAALSPRDLAKVDRDDPAAHQALALIVAGRLAEYDWLSRTSGADFPGPNEGDPPSGTIGKLLWGAVRLIALSPTPSSAQALREATHSDLPVDFRACALLLLMSTLGYLGENQEALREGDEFLQRDSEPLFLADLTILLQCAIRAAGIADYGQAATYSRRAIQLLGPVHDEQASLLVEAKSESTDILRKVTAGLAESASENYQDFEARASNGMVANRRINFTQFWAEKDALIFDSSVRLLQEGFDRTVRDPGTENRPFTIGADDVIFRRHAAFALGCNLASHWRRTREATALLGRERLSRAADVDSPDVWALGLSLLWISDQAKSLEPALRLIASEGPLSALADVGHQALHWTTRTPSRSQLLIARYAAPLYAQTEVDELVTQLLQVEASTTGMDSSGWYAESDELWKCVAGLAYRSSYPDEILDRMEPLVSSEDALVLRRLGDVAQQLDWSAVSNDNKRKWLDLVQPLLEGDTYPIAVNTLIGLWKADYPFAVRPIESAFRASPSLRLAEVLAGIATYRAKLNGLNHLLPSIVDVSLSAMARDRESAKQGAYGFGGPDSAYVSCLVAAETSSDELWREVGEYLTDPRLPIDHKAAALDWIARHHERTPVELTAQLISRPDVLQTSLIGDFDSGKPNASGFRALTALGALPDSAVWIQLTQLATDRDSRARSEAARCLPSVAGRHQHDLISSVGLQLANDSDVIVRRSLGRVLGNLLALDLESRPREILYYIASELLNTDGVVVPAAVITGLEEEGAKQVRLPIPPDLQTSLYSFASVTRSPSLASRAQELLNTQRDS